MDAERGQSAECREKSRETYNDDAADKHQVPYQILLLRELGVALFKLAQVGEDEVCVKQHRYLWACQQKTRHQSVNTGWELEEKMVVEEEWVAREHSRVDTDGAGEDGSSNRPVRELCQLELLARKKK